MDFSHLILFILVADADVWGRDFGKVRPRNQFNSWRKTELESSTKVSEVKSSNLLTKVEFRPVRRTTTKLVAVSARPTTFGWLTPIRTVSVPQNVTTLPFITGSARGRKAGLGQPTKQMDRKECADLEPIGRKQVANLLMELMRYLEGDRNRLVNSLREAAIVSHILVDTGRTTPISRPEDELYRKVIQVSSDGYAPNDPDQVYPHLMTIAWLVASDQATMQVSGWCPLSEMNVFLLSSNYREISERLIAAEKFILAVRYTVQEFIQSVSLDPYNNRRTRLPPSTSTVHESTQRTVSKPSKRLSEDVDIDADEWDLLDDYDEEENGTTGNSQLRSNEEGRLGRKMWGQVLAACWFLCSFI